jgi:hypothetical protein
MDKYILTIKENTLSAFNTIDLSDKDYIEFMASCAVNYAQGLTYDGVNIHIEYTTDYEYDFKSDPLPYETVYKAKSILDSHFKDYVTVNIIKQPF